MKNLCLVLVLLASSLDASAAFTTKKREPTAFTKTAPVSQQPQQPHQHPESHSSTVTGTSSYAFAPNAVSYYDESSDDLDDEVNIGYGTALISCTLALALGFGLGYGT